MATVRDRTKSLFDDDGRASGDAVSRTLHRRGDPETSIEGAEDVAERITPEREFALGWVRRFPGSTAAELDRRANSRDGRVRKRLAELERIGATERGSKRRCAVTGRNAHTWTATSATTTEGFDVGAVTKAAAGRADR